MLKAGTHTRPRTVKAETESLGITAALFGALMSQIPFSLRVWQLECLNRRSTKQPSERFPAGTPTVQAQTNKTPAP